MKGYEIGQPYYESNVWILNGCGDPLLLDEFTTKREAVKCIKDFLKNPMLYSVAFGDDSIKIKSIKELPKEPEYTHALTLTLPENADEGSVNLYFCPPPYPLWLEEVNDDFSDSSVAMTMKTTGIKYIIEGISDAFASTCVNNPAPFTNGDKVFTPKVGEKPIPVLAGWKFRLDKKANSNKSSKQKK